MTDVIRTVRNPKLILVACKNSERIAAIIASVLDACSYSTGINECRCDTEFCIATAGSAAQIPQNAIPDIVVFDGERELPETDLSRFRKLVGTYEYAGAKKSAAACSVLTYSYENEDADVSCRNITENEQLTAFEIVDSGILSRIRIDPRLYSVDEVLICMAVFTAMGVPIASVSSFFNLTSV